ncbi:Protein of unknown function DUF342 [Halanaerobium saccharolyticum subsp. saccharolyticum DSM 6643]|uniref:Flagellar Assembly Protein A N-terminal region domain-containing protein n=1 Tax=Halanaerobium saccharolyticum subsp. saccharolyticum DSM 6643 TaxID=1293054 RepID=M5E3H1_9FIRM|nr:FapA family protein [Halanaerobium saccharolyticum]CCU80759.1 Protein of unknown function DUF342 [Halanaerobium saccharolyticum subsp. saccharolyticum DSM 6643]
MENLKIEISADKLKAFLIINTEVNDLDLELADIEKVLAEENISYGINKTKIKTILDKDKYPNKTLIAEGKAPTPGKDGKLIYHFEEKKKQAGTLRKDGTMDFHSLDLINNVRKGEKIVTKVEAEAGKPGINIKGQKVAPPKMKNPKLPRSKNAVKKDNSLYSAVDGQIVREFQKIVIKDVYTVNGDVDLSTGNINFVGSVKINGNVKEGFKIEADGDIEIAGNAGACELKSTGNILIKKGFVGRNKGTASAEGDFYARFIENASVEANNVRVYEAIMHSNIKAKDSIKVTEGKGLIVGGKIISRNLIEANLIGSSLATKTLIEIGMMPKVKQRLKEAKEEQEKIIDNLNKVQKSIEMLESMQEKGITLPADKKELLTKVKRASLQLTVEKKKLGKEIKELTDEINNSPAAVVKVKDCIFSGVQILTSHDKKIILNKLLGCKFKEENKEIRQISD